MATDQSKQNQIARNNVDTEKKTQLNDILVVEQSQCSELHQALGLEGYKDKCVPNVRILYFESSTTGPWSAVEFSRNKNISVLTGVVRYMVRDVLGSCV